MAAEKPRRHELRPVLHAERGAEEVDALQCRAFDHVIATGATVSGANVYRAFRVGL